MQRLGKKIKNWLIYRFICGVIWLVNRSSRKWALGFCGLLGLIAYYLSGSARRRTIHNLQLALGCEICGSTLLGIARRTFINLGKSVADALRLIRMDRGEIDRLIRVEGLEFFDQAYESGRGVIALTGHLGNWELLAAWFAQKGYRVSVIGRKLYDPRLNRLLVAARQRIGLTNISTAQGIKPIIQALRRGEAVGILGDQAPRGTRSLTVNFFGQRAKIPEGPALLSMRTGAPIVPLAIHRDGSGLHTIVVRRPLELSSTKDPSRDIEANTAMCAKAVEKLIREHLDQWIWMHDRWR